MQDRRPAMNTFPLFYARILVGGDDRRFITQAHRSLKTAGFRVESAEDYDHLETFWHMHLHEIILLAVSRGDSLPQARAIARRLARHHTRPFVGYVADATLHGGDLEDEAVFPVTVEVLPKALREFFGPQMR